MQEAGLHKLRCISKGGVLLTAGGLSAGRQVACVRQCMHSLRGALGPESATAAEAAICYALLCVHDADGGLAVPPTAGPGKPLHVFGTPLCLLPEGYRDELQ